MSTNGPGGKILAGLLSLGIFIQIASLFTANELQLGSKGVYPLEVVEEVGSKTLIGRLLFTDYILSFEIIAIPLASCGYWGGCDCKTTFSVSLFMIPIEHILLLSALLFIIGVLGVMLRRNVIVIFMSIELMLNAVNLSFVTFARSLDSMTGVVFIFFIIVVAAAEAVVGLSIILSIFRTRKTLNIDEFNLLKW
ncbi:MAG: hypothetical protein Ct9H300mP21_08810 [Pseudomonadota bacterium]|nr:MAG: hypothetical protein Ct9H300mP21_08810 [Pseudomonadota bacterium]